MYENEVAPTRPCTQLVDDRDLVTAGGASIPPLRLNLWSLGQRQRQFAETVCKRDMISQPGI